MGKLKPKEPMSQEDQVALWSYQVLARGDPIGTESEMKYLVELLRQVQLTPDEVPKKDKLTWMLLWAAKDGIYIHADEDMQVRYEKLRHFYRQFLKLASAPDE